jgi:hypothetical protein
LAIGEQGSAISNCWKFAPQVYPNSLHPIVKNWWNQICNLSIPNVKKTILLESSQYSKNRNPNKINLNIVAEETSPNDYLNTVLFGVQFV